VFYLFVFAVIGAIADLLAIFAWLGITPNSLVGVASMQWSKKWKLILMLSLLALSLGLSGYGFYLARHPIIVEKIVEKPVDRIVEKVVEKRVPIPCPKAKQPASADEAGTNNQQTRRFVDLTGGEATKALEKMRELRSQYRSQHDNTEPSRSWLREELKKDISVDIGPPSSVADCPPGTGMLLNDSRIGEIIGNSLGGACITGSDIDKFNGNGALGPPKN
jgi:hypothetical protein